MHLMSRSGSTAARAAPPDQAQLNDRVWSASVAQYAGYDTWTDVGERVLLHRIAPLVRGTPVLDVGVGAGRSTWLLRLLSDRYVGVDFNASMIAAARCQFPGVDLRVADARDLSMFEDGGFGLVYFSHAGIDALDHAGRRRALDELARVTRPGGYVAYSTLNRDGPFWHCGPGPVGPVGGHPGPYHYARFVARVAQHPVRHAASVHNARGVRRLAEDHGDWGTDTMPTHGWALLVHYVTARLAVREPGECGLEFLGLLGDDGFEVDPEVPQPRARWFHVLSRRPTGT